MYVYKAMCLQSHVPNEDDASNPQAETPESHFEATPPTAGWNVAREPDGAPESEDGAAAPEDQASDPQTSDPHQHRMQQQHRQDCWTQNRTAMAGAVPCWSEGVATPGNAKVDLLSTCQCPSRYGFVIMHTYSR